MIRAALPVLRWLPALAWAAVIWILSSRPVVPAVEIPYVDKVFHAGEFGVLALLLAWAAAPALSRYRPPIRMLVVVVVSLFYGIADEAHQAFVPGRSCDAADVAADLAGAAIAAVAWARLAGRLSPSPGSGTSSRPG